MKPTSTAFKIFAITLLLALLAALQLIAGCTPAEPPDADKRYLEDRVDYVIAIRRAVDPSEICARTSTAVAGQFVLVQVTCISGQNIEVGFHASGRNVYRQMVWLNEKKSDKVTEERLMLELGAPQMEAWMLIDMRDRP